MWDGAIREEEKQRRKNPFPRPPQEPGGGGRLSISSNGMDPAPLPTQVTQVPRACAGSFLAPYRHAWLPLLPTDPLGAGTALGTSRREVGGWPRLGLTQAGPGTPSPTCSPLSPGMPGTPRAPGTDCPGGPLSPCKRTYAPDVAGGSGASLLSPVPWMCCFPCPHTLGMPVQVGMGMGMGSSPAPGQAGSHPLGRGDTREDPKASELAGQGQSWDMAPDATNSLLTPGTGPSPPHGTQRGTGHSWWALTFWPCMPSGPRGPTLPGGPGGPGAPSLPRGPGPPIMPGAPCRRAEGEAGDMRAPRPQSRRHGHPPTPQVGIPKAPAPVPSCKRWGFVVTYSLVT